MKTHYRRRRAGAAQVAGGQLAQPGRARPPSREWSKRAHPRRWLRYPTTAVRCCCRCYCCSCSELPVTAGTATALIRLDDEASSVIHPAPSLSLSRHCDKTTLAPQRRRHFVLRRDMLTLGSRHFTLDCKLLIVESRCGPGESQQQRSSSSRRDNLVASMIQRQ